MMTVVIIAVKREALKMMVDRMMVQSYFWIGILRWHISKL